MNLVVPFFGGMPVCHGAGGLAGQYYYGVRTGGTNILEGIIEISLGLFFASSVAGIFTVFPTAIIGAMMLLVGLELVKFAQNFRPNWDLLPLGATIIVSLLSNIAFGFIAGLIVDHLIRFAGRHSTRSTGESRAQVLAPHGEHDTKPNELPNLTSREE